MKDNIFLVLGGDNRSLYLGEYLEKQGYSVKYYGFKAFNCFKSLQDAINYSSTIILPLPLTRDNITLNAPYFDEGIRLDEIAYFSSKDKIIFGGKLTKSFCEKLDEKEIYYEDYLLYDELALYNAIPTAEGAIGLLINSLPITIHNMEVGILGYGRIGKALGDLLKALGANVTVFLRSEKAFAEAFSKNLKAKSFSTLKDETLHFDALINTVPKKILSKEQMENLNPDCLLIELASAPFGIDFVVADELAFKVIKSSSLPGQTAPKTAGEIIGRSILPKLKLRGF